MMHGLKKEKPTDTTKKMDKGRPHEYDKELLDILNMPALDVDEKVKEGKGLKMLTTNKL